MAAPSDIWYVRLPDGRVIRAKSTKSLRYHLKSGRIPADARVRRSAAEQWTALGRTGDVADGVAKEPAPAARASVSSNGVNKSKSAAGPVAALRHLADALITALDNALSPIKLKAAAGLGVALGLAGVYQAWSAFAEPAWAWIANAAVGTGVLAIFCLVSAVITQMTFVELSRLRPARSREMRAGLGRHTVQLLGMHVLVGGLMLLISTALIQLPSWLLSADGAAWPDGLVAPVIVLRMIWEVVCWPLWFMLLLFAPIAVIEEGSFVRSSREWLGMARRHCGRVLLYETMAILIGLLASAPFLVPVLLLSWGYDGMLGVVSQSTWAMLLGLAVIPLLAYVPVANVFLYLSLRYEFSQRPG